MQLSLFDPPAPSRIDCPQHVKTPDDVYRAELRLVFHPDAGRSACAVEVTHDGSRELVSWVMLPIRDDGETGALALLADAVPELQRRVQELFCPF